MNFKEIFPFFFSHFFYSKTYISELLNALLVTVTLQKKSLISEAAFFNLKDCQFFFDPNLYLASSRPYKNFRHLTSPELIWRMKQIAHLMVSFGEKDVLVNYLTDQFKGIHGDRSLTMPALAYNINIKHS